MTEQSALTVKLVEEVREGREHSFEYLYRQWVQRLYSFVIGYVKSESIADDIVQETFVRIWDNREALDSGKSFKAYLFTISYHMIIKELRRQVRNPLMMDFVAYEDEMRTKSTEGEKLLDYDLFVEALAKAKMHLTPRQRQIFELNKELDIPVAEIAERLGITLQVVRNQLSAAMRVMREKLPPLAYMLFLLLADS